MGIFDRFRKKKNGGQTATGYSQMIGSTPDQARMNEIRFNDFSQDQELPESYRYGSSTADIAAYKMLKNVTPEMLQDPVFADQLNRFVGGNYASGISKRIADAEKDPNAVKSQVRAHSFRNDPIDNRNLTTLMNLHLAGMKYGSESLNDRLMSDFGEGSEQEAMEVLKTLNTVMAPGMQGEGLVGLLGTAAQGMNNSRTMNDHDRSEQMMNHLMLRSISPMFAKKGAELRVDGQGHEDVGAKMVVNAQALQRAVNTPDNLEKHGYGYDSVREIKQFAGQLAWDTGSGASSADSEYVIPKNEYTSQRYEAPAQPKKHFWDRFKRKKTA